MGTVDWAAVQAVGSILAIVAGFGIAFWQNKQAAILRQQDRDDRERDRNDRAEVVAYRLSVWLSEVGVRVRGSAELYGLLKVLPFQKSAAQLKLNMEVGIENVMSDLHYLKAGAGDVAQLNYYVQYFDALLDTAKSRESLSSDEWLSLHNTIKAVLKAMLELHANAQRHLVPIIKAAVEKER